MRGSLTPKDIVSLIEALDAAVGDAMSCLLPDDSNRVSLVVAGSAPLMYRGWIPYTADDIDYISCSSSWAAVNILPQYHCNNRIQAFGDSWTYNYEDRLELLCEGEWLDVSITQE